MADEKRRYLFTGGGTGGHVTPNLAMISAIRAAEPGAQVLYLGSRRGYETRLRERDDLRFGTVACAPFCSPRRPLRFVLMAMAIVWGTFQALAHCLRQRPHVVVATGGYVSVPAVLAAWILRRRIFLHEQNAHPGMANRLLSLFATRIGVSFRESLAHFPKGKTVHTGYPVRPRIRGGSAERARERFGIAADKKVAFIFGGSMGSRSINRGTVEALKTLLRDENLAIIHATGLMKNGSYKAYEDTARRLRRIGLDTEVAGRYVCRPFINRIEDVFALSDLVIARAGAGAVMELAVVGKPSILIPKSDAPGDHQLLNAIALQKTGSAQVLLEEMSEEGGSPITRVRGDALARKITGLLEDSEELVRMGRRAHKFAVPDALEVNAHLVQRLASGEPLIEKVIENDRVGLLIDQEGATWELLFRNNIVGNGLLADIPLAGRRDGARAILQRTRRGAVTEFHLVPRRGPIQVGGQPVRERTRLDPEDQIRIGGARFTFTLRERDVERQLRTSGMGLKVLATGLGTLISRSVGFLREAITAAVFGLGNVMDVVAVGLTVSNFFRGVFAEMAVDNAFLPTFVHLNRTGRRGEANRLLSSLVMLTLVATSAVALVAMITLPAWLPWLAPGFATRGIMPQAIEVTRIMFPYLILISLAAIFSAVLKACDRFAVPAFSSIMFSVGILGGVGAHCFFGVSALVALGYGVLAGGLGQVLIQLPALLSPDVRRGYGVRIRPVFDLRSRGIRKIGRIAPNVVADSSIQKMGGVVDKILATPLAAGMVSALYFALVIFRLPFGLISQSVNTVILKELSEVQAVQDREAVRRLLVKGINWTVFTLLPMSVAMVILAEQTVRLLFEYASFSPADTEMVALALRLYAVGLVGWGIYSLCGRFFAARLEQNLATATSFAALVINVVASVALVKLGFGIAGIALGTSIAFLSAAALRVALLNRRLEEEGIGLRRKDVVPSLVHSACATAGAAAAALVALSAVSGFSGLPLVLDRLFVLAVPSAFGAFAFLATALLVRSEQLDEIIFRFGRRRRGAAVEAQEPAPLNPYCLPAARLLSWVRRNPTTAATHSFARRITIFLNSPDWRVRNNAIKLVSELRLATFRYDLCAVITCRERAPFGQRILGGDYTQPGFLRRNAIGALESLGSCDPEVEAALLGALAGDPYYEARAEAARVLGCLAEKLSAPMRRKARELLGRATQASNFEVAARATYALAQVATTDDVMADFKALHYHRNWQVRDRVVLAYGLLFDRGVIADRKRVLALLDDVLTTSEGFVPRFVLKEHLAELQQRLLRIEVPGAARVPPASTRELEAQTR